MARKMMIAIGLVGYRPFRHNYRGAGYTPTPQEKEMVETVKESNTVLIDTVVKHLSGLYGKDGFYLVTIGCDIGFGRDVSRYCFHAKQRFVQLDTQLQGSPEDTLGNKLPWGAMEDMNAIFKSRHAALIELCHSFFIKVNSYRSQLDDLIIRVKSTEIPYYIYDEENTLLEYRGDPSGEEAKEG